MQENLSQKDNTEITKERRFELPVQEKARERLDNFRDTVKQIQKENPEVLGATVYGSMIKGQQAREESDVDAFLYVDTENQKTGEENPDDYRNRLLEKLGAKDNENSKYYEDIRVQPLSEKIIDREINDQLDFYKKTDEYKKMLNEKYGEASEEEKEKLLRQEPDFRTIQFGISGMFHARVGSGIEKYRKSFLEKIVAMNDKDKSEKLWGEVASQLRTMENRKDPNIQIETPDTLNVALRRYAPELYSAIREKEDKEKMDSLRLEILKS